MRNPSNLYDYSRPVTLFGRGFTPKANSVLVVRKNGKIIKTVQGEDYWAGPARDLEIFSVYSGEITHGIGFPIGENPIDAGGFANISLTYKVSNATRCIEQGSLENGYLSQFIIGGTSQSLREFQIESKKRLHEFKEADYKGVQDMASEKFKSFFEESGFRFRSALLRIIMPENEQIKQQATRQVELISEFLKDKNALEIQQLNTIRSEKEAETRHAISMERLNGDEFIRTRKEYLGLQIETSQAVRSLIGDLEQQLLQKDNPLTQAIIYQRITDIAMPLLQLDYLQRTHPDVGKNDSGSNLLEKVVDSALRSEENPIAVKIADSVGKALSQATIQIRQGNLSLPELAEDLIQVLQKLRSGGKNG